jgi:nucleoside-diphosphate-sugar epimerase
MTKNVFITGASGCIGHYVFEELVNNPDYHLYLFIRNPKKLRFNPAAFKNVTIVNGNMLEIQKQSELLKKIDYLIHIAAAWGSSEVNHKHALELFNELDPSHIKKVIYFSTASILGKDNKPNPTVEKIGTHYIRSKYEMFQELPKLPIYDKITTIFPTWVIGGDALHPSSHAMDGLRSARKWLKLIRFLSIDFSFHFIHSKDIAIVVKYILENKVDKREYVLGNQAISADQLIDNLCAFYKVKRSLKFKVSSLIKVVTKLFGWKISAWDRYCLEQRHLLYDVANPSSFGIAPAYPDINRVLEDIK